MKEIFKTIKNYPNYQISNLGNVKNKKTDKILSKRKSNNGYLRVNVRTGLIKYEKPHTIMIHKLVAEYFVPKIKGKNYVNHIDGNKENNCVNNLEWVTAKENSIHSIKMGLQIPKKGKENKLSKKIFCYDKMSKNLLFIFYGAREAERETGINRRDIWNNLNGKQKTCKKYIFSYKEVV